MDAGRIQQNGVRDEDEEATIEWGLLLGKSTGTR